MASNDQNLSVDSSSFRPDGQANAPIAPVEGQGEVNPSQNKLAPLPDGSQPNLVINQIQIMQTVREKLDVQKWRQAHINAEAPYYPNRTRLYDMYEDIRLDGHLTGIIQKRLDTVLNKEVFYEGADGEKVDKMDGLITSKVFRDLMKMILEAQLYGLSGLEFIPGKELTFAKVPRKNIVPKTRCITLNQNQINGIPYDGLPLVFIVNEDPDDLGLLLKCAPYAIYKRGNLGDWANFIEIFGIPMRIIEYDANDQQTKIELKQVLDESGSALALMIPKQANFKALDGKQTNGDGRLQLSFMEALNGEMSITILGNTETTTQAAHGGGNNAKAKTHQEQQNQIAKSDIIYLCNWLNDAKFINILREFDYPVQDGGRFVFKKEIDIDYLSKLIDIDTQLPEDLPLDDDYWYDTYGKPKPKNYAALKKKLEDKQKAEKNVDDIQNDPKNKPAKGPVNQQKKPKKKTLTRIRKFLRKTGLAGFFP